MSEVHEFRASMQPMHEEYRAWQTIVFECLKLNIDMNLEKHERLIKAICVWGERLHRLRREQTQDQQDAALDSYIAQYEKAKKDNS